ncbi:MULTISPECIES: hypothetical protein [Pseudomonas syringae group genomosp. 2]|uniref:hypothetical protein n=1 Tax=Pseudomonas syringae group genomosp. 2 TaxID=251698 RepID=UPI001604B130|nr:MULTISPECIES: hypothetical protein [Pseudomonas syringae group genomosp. 2]
MDDEIAENKKGGNPFGDKRDPHAEFWRRASKYFRSRLLPAEPDQSAVTRRLCCSVL